MYEKLDPQHHKIIMMCKKILKICKTADEKLNLNLTKWLGIIVSSLLVPATLHHHYPPKKTHKKQTNKNKSIKNQGFLFHIEFLKLKILQFPVS